MQENLERRLIAAHNELQVQARHETISGLVFWVATALLVAGLVWMPSVLFGSGQAGIWAMGFWLGASAAFVYVSRRQRAAADRFGQLKKTAASRSATEFCEHDARCGCRKAFIDRMAAQGVDLYD